MSGELSKKQEKSDSFLSQAMSAADVVAQVKLVHDVMSQVMKDKEHYGVIPGTKKPTLYKAGAEKLCLLFRLSPEFSSVETLDGKHLTVKSICVLRHIPSGTAMGSGEAICSTKEKKYKYRKDGPRVVENNELEDCWNTVLKMANKRALVAATLVATAASDIFTQDMEDLPLVVVDAEATVKDTKKEADKDTKKVEKDKPKKEENGYSYWTGKVVEVIPEELPGGRACWTLKGFDGLEFKTVLEEHSTIGDTDYKIGYIKNDKGTFVIKSLEAVS